MNPVNPLSISAALLVVAALAFKGVPQVLAQIAPSTPVVEWEHGFKTKDIIATRYKNPMMGYNIGLRYTTPRVDDNADREEVFTFLQAQGCDIFQGGGGPFSEYFMTCKGVTDQPSANVKLQTLLPALQAFITLL